MSEVYKGHSVDECRDAFMFLVKTYEIFPESFEYRGNAYKTDEFLDAINNSRWSAEFVTPEMAEDMPSVTTQYNEEQLPLLRNALLHLHDTYDEAGYPEEFNHQGDHYQTRDFLEAMAWCDDELPSTHVEEDVIHTYSDLAGQIMRVVRQETRERILSATNA